MNKATLIVGIILLSLIAFATINLIQDFSTGEEMDYYLLKETTDAAMLDALDYNFYSESGSVRMDKEKFVESFLRRFANNVKQNRQYSLSFYDINETPPKVSVEVNASTNVTATSAASKADLKNSTGKGYNKNNDTGVYDVTTRYNAALETTYLKDGFTSLGILNKTLDAKEDKKK